MKILTKEEEESHYKYVLTRSIRDPSTEFASSETLKGGFLGGAAGLGVGILGVWGATARFPAFRQLTLPLRAFIVTSSTTFGGM